MYNEFCKLVKDSLQDNITGKYSHAKIIAMLGFIALTVFFWKLLLLGTISIEYFMAYAAYCTGHQTINKYLDGRRNNGTNNHTD